MVNPGTVIGPHTNVYPTVSVRGVIPAYHIVKEGGKLVIRSFYPQNLMQKLSCDKTSVEDWRQLVDSILIDWNYDGGALQPSVIDIPKGKDLVKGVYDIPEDAGTIKVKITDLLSESLEQEIR